jgi:hypothetical protein
MTKDIITLVVWLPLLVLYVAVRIITIWLKPDYRSVPTSRADFGSNPWKWFLWAIFGNDHDGPCGENINLAAHQTDGHGFEFGGGVRSQEAFKKWHNRNWGHNLAFFVIPRRPLVNPYYVIGRPVPEPDSRTPYALENFKPIVLRFNPFLIRIVYVGFGWRADAPQGVLGKFDQFAKDLT